MLINALITYVIHINLNMIFYTLVEHSPAKTIYIKYYTEKQTHTQHTRTHTHTHTRARTHTHTHTHTHTQWLEQKLDTDISWDENTMRRGRFSVWL